MPISLSLKDTYEISKQILQELEKTKQIAFYGNLGSGKTEICRNMIRLLCDNESMVVPSPTFNLVYSYRCPAGIINHLDLYRLKSLVEIEELGLTEMLVQNQICFVEWPEIIQDYVEAYKFLKVYIQQDDQKRIISWQSF